MWALRRGATELDQGDIEKAKLTEELGLQQIADRLALTESAVRSRLHRARTRLRSLLEKHELTAYTAAA